MPIGPVQRFPLGLQQLLSIYGVSPPSLLSEVISGTVDFLQMIALTQRRIVQTNDPALAENGSVSVLPSAPGIDRAFAVLFTCNATVIKTATMTAARIGVLMQRQGSGFIPVASEAVGPFGATETGAASCVFTPPYPLLLVPPWDVRAILQIVGTDATANVTVQAEIGVLQ